MNTLSIICQTFVTILSVRPLSMLLYPMLWKAISCSSFYFKHVSQLISSLCWWRFNLIKTIGGFFLTVNSILEMKWKWNFIGYYNLFDYFLNKKKKKQTQKLNKQTITEVKEIQRVFFIVDIVILKKISLWELAVIINIILWHHVSVWILLLLARKPISKVWVSLTDSSIKNYCLYSWYARLYIVSPRTDMSHFYWFKNDIWLPDSSFCPSSEE